MIELKIKNYTEQELNLLYEGLYAALEAVSSMQEYMTIDNVSSIQEYEKTEKQSKPLKDLISAVQFLENKIFLKSKN